MLGINCLTVEQVNLFVTVFLVVVGKVTDIKRKRKPPSEAVFR
uniref:Uncharacterized protein n=1 Tax=Rheinheimera sp. BAL341 TaxID=1708203 RepID=A0A486XLG1_9GAMM